MLEILKIAGAALGIAAFIWKVWDVFSTFLHMSLSVDLKEDGSLSALTVVENKGLRRKNIDFALLLVGPEHENPITTFNSICEENQLEFCADSTNRIADCNRNPDCEFDETYFGREGRVLIPLTFYFWENISIGDERISYRAPIPTEGIPANTPYSVRFFVKAHARYHRSTHDSFVLGTKKRA